MPYKSAIFSLLLLAAVASGLPACSVDTADMTDSAPADEETASGVRYLSLRVSTSDAGKTYAVYSDSESGFDYQYGTDFEHAVDFTGTSENVIIYINSDYKYEGYSLLEFDAHSSQGKDETLPSEEVYIGFLRPSGIDEIYHLPDYGMVVLNAYGITEALDRLVAKEEKATIDDVLGLVDNASGSHIAGRSGNYFTMASAAYLTKKNNQWTHSVLFEIDKDMVFDTRIQAVLKPAATAVVERMSAKFSLSFDDNKDRTGLNFRPDEGRAQVIVCNYIDGQPNYNNRTWNCTVTAWGINKYEPGSYYFRNIVADGDEITKSSYPYTYGNDIDTPGKPFFMSWNNDKDHRAFWAVDPHYNNDGVYPTQFRAAVDNKELNYYGKEGKQPSLNYVSFNELSTDFSNLDSEGCVNLYSPENTFSDETRQEGRWQHDLAGCEVVIGARIHVTGVNEQSSDYDLYRNRIGVFYPSVTDFASYVISTINTQLASQSKMTYRYYDWSTPTNNSGTVLREFTVDKSGYKLYLGDQPLTAEVMAAQMSHTIPATIENGDGKVIPWVKGMYIGRRDVDPNTYEEVGSVQRKDINENELKSLIYDWIGPFDHFNGGRMVYSVPVRYRASENTVKANNYRPAVGDYGVVRNSWYHIVIDAINNLGTPVDNPDQKIIPYEANLDNSIMMQINVIKWHEFATDVTLPGKIK